MTKRKLCRVDHWRSGYRPKFVFSVSPRFLWECHNISTIPYLQRSLISRVENWRTHFRPRVSKQALSIARWVHSLRHSYVSSSRLDKRNVRISRIALSCQLHPKVYVAY